jgi:deferrochelatase/peroxidase EfeB
MPNTAMPPRPDPSNVQGMILRGYTHPYSCHMLFTFASRPGAAEFIRVLIPYLQSAQDWGDNKPARMLNIGLTYDGILMFDGALKGQFPSEFKAGPASPDSQLSLNDIGGPGDPSLWWNGYKPAIHCIVHSYGMTADALGSLVETVSQAAQTNGVTECRPLQSGSGRLEEYAPLQDYIHFGYHDGIDNPVLGWPDDPADTVPSDANKFLIGYPGKGFIPGPQSGAAAEFAKDGCYNAFRVLYQDVGAFDRFLANCAQEVVTAIGGSLDDAKEWLAAKLVGRWRNGSPLVLSPDAPNPATGDATNFDYSADSAALKCPLAAHTRVANPRDESTFNTDTPVPRLLRRGMPYGAPPAPPDYNGERGLIGLFLCGSLANQFEKLYSWINVNNFSNVFLPNLDTQDPLIANRLSPSKGGDPSFTIPIPNSSSPIKIPTLPPFVVTRGTAYCLLPSVPTLQRLAGMA